MSRPRLLALLVAVVLGVTGGVATARLGSSGDPAQDGSFADPLHLGVPLEDVECTGEDILVVGEGNTAVALSPAVADFPTAHYLALADSCPTYYFNVQGTGERPAYVAYLGPYPAGDAACQERMTNAHSSDYVTRLTRGNQSSARCACVLKTEDLPDLDPDMPADVMTPVWVKAMQNLILLERPGARITANGTYDAATIAAVKTFQRTESLPVTGLVDGYTWKQLRDRSCRFYDY